MPDKKISELDAATSVTSDDLIPHVDAPGGTPVTKKITVANFVTSLGSLLTALVALTISGSLYLSAQPAGRVLYTESGGAATTTPNLTYTTTTQILGVPNLNVSTSGTVNGLSWVNATGTNATTTKLYSTTIASTSVSSTRFLGQRNSSGCGTPAFSTPTANTTGINITQTPYTGVWVCSNSSIVATFEAGTASLYADWYPGTNNNRNLGLSAFYWNTLYSTNVTSTNVTTTNLFVKGNSKLGTRNTNTIQYVGTGDGCGAWTFTASNTSPTLTPTSTSNCN